VDANGRRKARTAVECATLALFLAALYAPLVDQMVRPSSVREPLNENRTARPRPPFPRTPRKMAEFPAAFEAHHADTFGLRDVLLRWNSIVKLDVFGESPTPTLVIDDSGWVDYAGESTLEVWRGALPMQAPYVKEWVDYLTLCRDFCAKGGAQYYFLAVPNKETIYPDHVPAKYTRIGPTHLEQVEAALPEDLRAVVVDPRDELRAARAGDVPPLNYLYSTYGTHWNGRGTWVTYVELMRALGSGRDDVRALTDKEVELRVDGISGFDSWGPRMYVSDRFLHTTMHPEILGPRKWEEIGVVNTPFRIWRTRNESVRGPKVLVFHDSFGAALEDLLASSFPEITFVHSWFDPAIVLAHNPDIVVEERVERMFVGPPMVSAIGRRIMGQDSPPPGSGDLVFTIDARSPDSALVTTGPAHIERMQDGIAFRAENGKAGWFLPEFTLETGRRAWLHVDVESQERGLLVAYAKSNVTGTWTRQDAAYVPFAAGRTERTVELPGAPGLREIRLQVSSGPAGVLVRRLEVRTTRP
jgi:hypothetical protein